MLHEFKSLFIPGKTKLLLLFTVIFLFTACGKLNSQQKEFILSFEGCVPNHENPNIDINWIKEANVNLYQAWRTPVPEYSAPQYDIWKTNNVSNPFNPITKINYDIPQNSIVKLTIYDILGREVIKLVNNEFKQPGRYVVEFNGTNLASGVYFYRLEAGEFINGKKNGTY